MAAVPAFADPSVGAKKAEAAQAMVRLNALNDSLEQKIQRYDLAQVRLQSIRHDVDVNRQEGRVARRNLALSQRAIAQRLVMLYTSNSTSTLEVILGARSLDDVIARVDAERSVTSLDANVLQEVKHFRSVVKRSAKELAVARAAQQRIVGGLGAQRRSIEGQIAEQQRLVSSLHGEIAKLEAAAQARQLLMVRQTVARLAAEKAAGQEAGQDNTVVGITAATPDGETVVPPSSYTGVVGAAMAELGKPYVWAAAGPDSFDCSGLVMFAYAQVGVSLPHSSYAQWSMGVPVPKDQLQPGDLVFFDGLGHVGIYVGGGEFIQAPHTGTVVQITDLDSGSYASSYVGARRIL